MHQPQYFIPHQWTSFYVEQVLRMKNPEAAIFDGRFAGKLVNSYYVSK